jgi:hypothetical protein
MAIPYSAAGYGNVNKANVFRVTFSTALNTAPDWEAYDGGTFPAVGAAVTTANDVFVGTAGNGNIPMLSLAATTSSAPGVAWEPAAPVGGGAVTINRMKGVTNFVTDPTTPGAAGAILFNLVLNIPSDVTTASTMAHDLLVRYTFTGAAPALTWAGNDTGAGGTEGAPSWTNFVPGTNGIRHTRVGVTGGGPYLLNIPAAGTVDAAMGWVTI